MIFSAQISRVASPERPPASGRHERAPSGTVLFGKFGATPAAANDPDDVDDDDHRTRVNLAAAAAILVLIAIGVWLTNAMVETQKAHGCYSSGDRTCSLI
jgi:hypothetical protein